LPHQIWQVGRIAQAEHMLLSADLAGGGNMNRPEFTGGRFVQQLGDHIE
jgi:hypothetical protein